MAFHRCDIRGEGGKVVAEGVEVALQVNPKDGEAIWFGTISVTDVCDLEAGVRYRMELDDGRAGEIVVQRNTYVGGVDRAVSFRGAGPLG